MKMGFEGRLYYGPPGETADILIENVRDVTFNFDHTTVDTTVRGAGAVDDGQGKTIVKRPAHTEDISQLVTTIEFTMPVPSECNTGHMDIYRELMAAAATGEGIAIRGLDVINGKGPDFDAIIKGNLSQPLVDVQMCTFTATPTYKYCRYPEMYV
jgi:hypothetical protein